MKSTIILLLFLAFQSLASAQDTQGMNMNKKDSTHPASSVTYTCVMHPQIHATKPGNCPICGMKLVKRKNKGRQSRFSRSHRHTHEKHANERQLQ